MSEQHALAIQWPDEPISVNLYRELDESDLNLNYPYLCLRLYKLAARAEELEGEVAELEERTRRLADGGREAQDGWARAATREAKLEGLLGIEKSALQMAVYSLHSRERFMYDDIALWMQMLSTECERFREHAREAEGRDQDKEEQDE